MRVTINKISNIHIFMYKVNANKYRVENLFIFLSRYLYDRNKGSNTVPYLVFQPAIGQVIVGCGLKFMDGMVHWRPQASSL